MAITLFPLTSDFASEVGDVDLRHPLAPDDLQALRDAFSRKLAPEAMMANTDTYFLGQSSVEQQRLRPQARELAGDSTWLFEQTGLARNARVVEIGCGPEGCLGLLADRVGP